MSFGLNGESRRGIRCRRGVFFRYPEMGICNMPSRTQTHLTGGRSADRSALLKPAVMKKSPHIGNIYRLPAVIDLEGRLIAPANRGPIA